MAMTYQNFASLGVNLNRQKYGPLDISNVFTSAADLKYYLTKGAYTEGVSEYWYKSANEKVVPYPYEGQVLATVIDGVVSVYALALNEKGEFITQEIAGKVEVDGSTIRLNDDGRLELVGLNDIDTSKTYVPSLVNGVLTWAEPDTSTAEGQTQEINALKARATTLEETVNGTDEADGLVKKVADNAQAIADEATARESLASEVAANIAAALAEAKKYADDNDADTIYDDTKVKEDIQANATAIAGINTELGNYYKKSETYSKDEIDSAMSSITHFTTKVVESTDEMTDEKVLYLVHDTTVTGDDKYNEYLVINEVPTLIGDTTTDLSGYATKAELEEHEEAAEAKYATKAQLEAHESAAAAAYATKTELTEHESAADNKYATKTALEEGLADKADATVLDNYYTKSDIEGKGYAVAANVASDLATKVDSATISHSTDEIPEGATVSGTQLNIVVDSFTKAETRQYVADTISQMTGGESAADVLLALNNYKDDNDARVGAIETKNNEQDTAINKAQEDATKANSDIAGLNTTVGTHGSDLEAIKGRLTPLETAKGEHETRLGVIDGKLTALEAEDLKINTLLGEIAGKQTALESEDARLGSLIQANTTAIDTKADKTALETLAGKVYTKTEVDTLLQNLDLSTVNAAIAANTKAISDEKTRAESAEAGLSSRIDSIVGEDSGKTIRAIAGEEVAKVVDSAPEAFDTLKEIAVWIANDETGAAAMANQIAAHNTILAGFGGEGQPADVKTFVESSIAAAKYELPIATIEAVGGIKAAAATVDNAVQVAEDGIASVARINVNTLVQTEGETITLYGGKA